MSARNRPVEKQLRRLRRALRKGRTPAYIDLRDWLIIRGYATSLAKAEAIIAEERVHSESHTLGFSNVTIGDGEDRQEVKVFNPRVPASLRDSISVVEV